jgi:rubredoxin
MTWAGTARWRCRLCDFVHNLDYDTTCRSCEAERADAEDTSGEDWGEADGDPSTDETEPSDGCG